MAGSYEGKIATAQIERPREAAAAHVAPMNALERFLRPDALALAWPWGRIAMNQPAIEQSGQDPGDIMAHELVHIGQRQRDGLIRTMLKTLTASPDYLARPYEQEALMAEQTRPVRRTDIQLSDPNASVRSHLRKQVSRGR